MNTYYDEILEIPNPYDQVCGNLYIGGVLPSYEQFDTVVCVTPEATSHFGRTGRITHYAPFNDSSVLPDEEFLQNIVELVLNALNRGTVLVHCSAGINRSALVVALVMIRLGWSGVEGVEHLRRTRSCSILCNETFYNRVIND